jgi:hypothetical protein
MFVHKCLGVGVVALAGVGGYWLYKTYYVSDDADSAADDDYFAGLNFGISGWKPQLPIHPRSMLPTAEAVYSPVQLKPQRGKAWSMIPARSTDYANPAQFVASTGPGNLAPIAGVNSGLANNDVGPTSAYAGTIAGDSGQLTAAGPLPMKDATGYKVPSGKVLQNG